MVTTSKDIPVVFEPVERLSLSSRGEVWRVRRDSRDWVLRMGPRGSAAAPAELSIFGRLSGTSLVSPVEWGLTPSGRTYALRPWIEGLAFDEAVKGASAEHIMGWVRSLL